MNDDSRKTIIRHLKGIVAALEKDEKKGCLHDKGPNDVCLLCGEKVYTFRKY